MMFLETEQRKGTKVSRFSIVLKSLVHIPDIISRLQEGEMWRRKMLHSNNTDCPNVHQGTKISTFWKKQTFFTIKCFLTEMISQSIISWNPKGTKRLPSSMFPYVRLYRGDIRKFATCQDFPAKGNKIFTMK